MPSKPLPPQNELDRLLRYDAWSGKLYWRDRTPDMFGGDDTVSLGKWRSWTTRFANKEAFTATMNNGYLASMMGGKLYLAHRVIWKLVHGEDPNVIDHINGDRADNRLKNLRNITQAANMQNKRRYKRNTSGVTGVHRLGNAWCARISVNGEVRYLGTFATLEEAAAAREQAAREFGGYTDRHG